VIGGGFPVEVREEEEGGLAFGLEEVEEGEARCAGGAMDSALEGVQDLEDEARSGGEVDGGVAGLDGAEDGLRVDVVPAVEAVAVADADGEAAGDEGCPGGVVGVEGEAGVVGEADGVEEDGGSVGVVELGVVVAREEDALATGAEESGEGGEDVVSPGFGGDVGEGAAEEGRGAGHVVGRGAGVDLEEVDDVAGQDKGGIGAGVGEEEGCEGWAGVEGGEGARRGDVEVGEDEEAGGHGRRIAEGVEGRNGGGQTPGQGVLSLT